MRRLHGCQRGFGFGRALLLLALIAAALWAWWTYAPESVPEVVREHLPVAAPTAGPTLYKWKDDQGRWNVTDQPPAGRSYETVRVDPDTNVLPAGVPPEQDRD